MEISQIHARLEELTEIAKKRMKECSADLVATVGGAEINFMTHEELLERHELMLMMPTYAELREEARARIRDRIAERKLRRSAKQ